VCGPSADLDCRGADSSAELTRQLDKLLNALEALSPDIAGLMEIENDPTGSLQLLVDALNADLGAGTYAFLNTGTIGTDAIKPAFIYKPARVERVGTFALLTSAVDPLFIDGTNRPSLAQTFLEKATGAKFTVIANHFKSKGSDCDDVGDPDLGDGQGNCNLTRSNAAAALLSWIVSDPTDSNDPDYLLIGDLNAYANEDPVEILKQGQLTSLIDAFGGAAAYSYQYRGQSGSLDHAFATDAMVSQITGAAEWHSNADEPGVLDYNLEFKTDDPYNANDPFRSSDHDPLVIGVSLTVPPSPVPAGDRGWSIVLALAYVAGGVGMLASPRAVISQATGRHVGPTVS
jgi:predicted extracellular nuclease